MARCHFVDVYAGGGSLGDYPWPVNHSSEEEGGETLNIERTAVTAGVGYVRQLGEASAFTRRVRGTILDRAQYQKMWAFFEVCSGLGPGPQRTIHWIDQLGARFEIIFSAFNPVYQRVVSNPRGTSADERMVTWAYDATFEIVGIISGWP